MKFIITEDKRERLIDNELSNQYGGLKKGFSRNHPDVIFFIKDVEVPNEGDVVFHYNKDNQSAVIPWEIVDGIRMFTENEWEAELFVMAWLNETYGLNVVKLYKRLGL